MESLLKAALPGVCQATISRLEERLEEIGVINIEDFQYIEESYVSDILKPIQCKKFIIFCKEKLVPASALIKEEPPYSMSSLNEKNMPLKNETGNINSSINLPSSQHASSWAENFTVNWSQFPKELLEAAIQRKLPQKKHVNEMIRSLVTQIFSVDKNPGRNNLRIIAGKLVEKYPDSFQDRCGDIVVANGCTTIMKKLENCVENRKRRISFLGEDFGDNSEILSKRRKVIRDRYGCVNWQPTELPGNDTRKIQKRYQEWLKKEYTKITRNKEKIHLLMQRTYASQRYYINNIKTSITSIKKNWPFLLEEKYFLSHAEELLGFNLEALFSSEIRIKGRKIYNFMKTQVGKPQVRETLESIENAKDELQDLTTEINGAIFLLLAYFNEERELLFQEKDTNIVDDCVVLTPHVTSFGSSIYTAEKFAIVIDGEKSVYTKTFASAFTCLFASYFVFNIKYNKGTAHTMEFIQRCYANINPERGSKVQRKPNEKYYAVSPKVLTLVNDLKSFESDFNN